MKTSSFIVGKSGFVSYVLVLTTGAILTMLMVFTYRQAMATQEMQKQVQLRNDYSEKEDAILRSIVAILPNRAIRAMQSGSNASDASREPFLWKTIFKESLDMANARTSISSEVETELNIGSYFKSNSGDSSLGGVGDIFKAVNNESGYVSSGITTSQGAGFPPPLTSNNETTKTRDKLYPIITNDKMAVGLAADTTEPNFNVLKYPQINFGYAKPGDNFLAKRNWWAFSMNVSASDATTTGLNSPRRDFVLSIYEIPSQLAISTSAFVSLGRHTSGAEWSSDVNIEGSVFTGNVEVEGSLNLASISSRRGMKLSSDSRIGGQDFSNAPFEQGKREEYEVTTGEFYPVSLASESGRVAFIPINRGEDFFDRFGQTAASNVLSTTTWDNYTIGALQCAMNLDVTAVNADKKPTVLRFRAKKSNGSIYEESVPVVTGISQPLPPGYEFCARENESYDFGESVVDVAYGANGKFYYQSGVTSKVYFNNGIFGDPNVGIFKAGYWRPAAPFKVSQSAAVDPDLPGDTSWRVEIFPERIPAFLEFIGASDASINHSISVNVDYTTSGLNNPNYHPMKKNDPNYKYGLIMRECANLTSFTKGFSVVSNLRTYIADNFNVIPTTRPVGDTRSGDFYPPVSLFVPEKRFGLNADPTSVRLEGQIGSLASEEEATNLLDTKGTSGTDYTGSRLLVNLRPITHPGALPPINMMNWLVVLEEKRRTTMGGY